MSFQPRTFEEIRDDMIAFVRMQTNLTDFEVGSVIRTIIEAAALEDDEQYFQMVQLLDAFRLSTASGQDLDERVAEFGIIRLQPEAATGYLVIRDGNLPTSTVDTAYVSGLTLDVEDSTTFPTTGFPVDIRVGEGTAAVEEAQISANNTTNGFLTLVAPLTSTHERGERVSVVAGSDRPLSSGIRAQVPSEGTSSAIVFVTTESGTIVAGNYESTTILARAEVPGISGNVGASQVIEFATSPPFDGALVINKSNFAGGRDIESDADLRDRARAAIQSLSRGTILALREGVLGVADPVTGQRVTTANILESFTTNEVIVYVDDGTGFTPDQVVLQRTTIISASAGAAVLSSTQDMAEEGYIFLSPDVLVEAEIMPYSGVDHTTNTVTFVGTTSNIHAPTDEASVVDLVEDSAEAGEKFFQVANFPIIRGSFRLWVEDGTDITPVVENEDYYLNRGTGQIEFINAGLAEGARLVASYGYYTGLLAQVQKVIDGDPEDASAYPGLRAAGIRAIAETPVIRRITVRCAITAQPGFKEDDLIPSVKESIESYINGLGIGADVVVAEIIRRGMSVTGVQDMTVALPISNVIVLEDELPRPVDVNGNSLVTVN